MPTTELSIGILARMEHLGSSRRREQPRHEHAFDREEALEQIHELYERGERPVVSVPEQFAQAAQNGLSPHTTWIPGFDAIVGTFGREPYIPNNERRVLLRLELDESQIEPRFTGPDKAFDGVVVIKGPVPKEKIVVLH